MAQILETRTGQTILAETNGLAEFLAKNLGRVPNIGSQVALSYSGNTLKVGSGMLVYTGVKGVNTDDYETVITPTAVGTQTLYVTATMNGIFDTLVFAVSTTSAGSITSKTDILLGTTNVVTFDIGTVLNGTSGIISVTTTCPLAEYLPDQLSKYLPLIGGTMQGPINMNGNFINLRSGVSIQSPSTGRLNVTGNMFTNLINSQGYNITTQGAPLSCNQIFMHDTNGANGGYMLRYRDGTSFYAVRKMYSQAIDTQGNQFKTSGGDIETTGGNINTGAGNIDTEGGDTTTSKLTATSVLINSEEQGGFGGLVLNTRVSSVSEAIELMRSTYTNGGLQVRLGRNESPSNADRELFFLGYDANQSVNSGVRIGSTTAKGVLHQVGSSAYKLAYVNTSLNSAVLASNQLLLQNIEVQQEMAYNTPTIDFNTINSLEVQKQSIIEQNAIIEQEIIEIEQELEEIKGEE